LSDGHLECVGAFSGLASAVRNSGLQIKLLTYTCELLVPPGVQVLDPSTFMSKAEFEAKLKSGAPVQLMADWLRLSASKDHLA
jgi:hypothetical protein